MALSTATHLGQWVLNISSAHNHSFFQMHGVSVSNSRKKFIQKKKFLPQRLTVCCTVINQFNDCRPMRSPCENNNSETFDCPWQKEIESWQYVIRACSMFRLFVWIHLLVMMDNCRQDKKTCIGGWHWASVTIWPWGTWAECLTLVQKNYSSSSGKRILWT